MSKLQQTKAGDFSDRVYPVLSTVTGPPTHSVWGGGQTSNGRGRLSSSVFVVCHL